MGLRCGCWLSAHVHTVIIVATGAVLLNVLIQVAQPLSNQVDVLERYELKKRYLIWLEH